MTGRALLARVDSGDGDKRNPYDADKVRATIRAILAQRGLKPRPAAKRSGVAEGALRKYLAGGTASLTLESAVKLAAALQVSVSEMIGDPRAPLPGTPVAARRDEPPAAGVALFLRALSLPIARGR